MMIWHNGVYKNENEGSFSLRDRVRYGDGLFETILALNGKPIAFTDHIIRLYRDAEILNIPVIYAEEDLHTAARDVLRGCKLHAGQAVINILLSRGIGQRGLMPPLDAAPEVFILASPAPTDFPPVHAIIARSTRRNEASPLSRMKSLNYGDSILGLLEAQREGANEAIFLNNCDRIACTSGGNFYAIISDQIRTPPLTDGAMAGVIRQHLLAQGHAEEQSLTLDDLRGAEGLFLSNSVRGFYPILSLDGRSFPLAKSPIDTHFHLSI